jgi:hypothetical protein
MHHNPSLGLCKVQELDILTSEADSTLRALPTPFSAHVSYEVWLQMQRPRIASLSLPPPFPMPQTTLLTHPINTPEPRPHRGIFEARISCLLTLGSLVIKCSLFLVGLGFELRALGLQSRLSTAWTTPPVHFTLLILEMGSQELFALANLKPQPSGSLSPK